MELVLGIDNIVFIAILSSRLPPAQQPRARRLGLALALGTRLALLFSITWIMVAAIVIAIVVMLMAMNAVSDFVERHPSVKILALAFLVLIGIVLVADGMGQHVPKGYIYFSMAFALGVELLNMRFHRRRRVTDTSA